MNADVFGSNNGGYPAEINAEAWDAWLAYRRKRRLPKYETDNVMKRLMLLTHEQQADCVQHSIDHRYQGIFPEDYREKSQRSRTATRPDIVHSTDW